MKKLKVKRGSIFERKKYNIYIITVTTVFTLFFYNIFSIEHQP